MKIHSTCVFLIPKKGSWKNQPIRYIPMYWFCLQKNISTENTSQYSHRISTSHQLVETPFQQQWRYVLLCSNQVLGSRPTWQDQALWIFSSVLDFASLQKWHFVDSLVVFSTKLRQKPDHPEEIQNLQQERRLILDYYIK